MGGRRRRDGARIAQFGWNIKPAIAGEGSRQAEAMRLRILRRRRHRSHRPLPPAFDTTIRLRALHRLIDGGVWVKTLGAVIRLAKRARRINEMKVLSRANSCGAGPEAPAGPLTGRILR